MNDERTDRLEKLMRLKEQGINPYPSNVDKKYGIEQVFANFDDLVKRDQPVTLAGRLHSIRRHGGSMFVDFEDATGKIQLFFRRDEVGEGSFQTLKDDIDAADFIHVRGVPFVTKQGEKSVKVKSWSLLAKSLRPLPSEWHGLRDVEIRYRKRYLDLLANPKVVGIAKKRSAIVKIIRNFFDNEGFMEVETPILQPIPGGAAAQPFITHHEALDQDMYLRIAPELYLKRLVVGGLEKVYEIARCFRNEGIDYSHNPEFTQIEFYWAYADYNDVMDLTEKLIINLLETIEQKNSITFEGKEIKFKTPFPRISYRDAVKEHTGVDIEEFPDRDSLAKEVKKKGVKVSKDWNRGKLIDELFKTVRKNIIQPTFLIDYPIELTPLAKRKEDNPNYVQKCQLVVGGMEITNAYTELNDPLDQKERFDEQQKLYEAGDIEAQPMDEDFLEALEHGMPPTTGLGMGIDRLAALFTDSHSVKEVILFPTLKREK